MKFYHPLVDLIKKNIQWYFLKTNHTTMYRFYRLVASVNILASYLG